MKDVSFSIKERFPHFLVLLMSWFLYIRMTETFELEPRHLYLSSFIMTLSITLSIILVEWKSDGEAKVRHPIDRVRDTKSPFGILKRSLTFWFLEIFSSFFYYYFICLLFLLTSNHVRRWHWKSINLFICVEVRLIFFFNPTSFIFV